MAIFDTYSKRLRRLQRAGQPDVYTFDQIPTPLRVQIAHICVDALGKVTQYGNPNIVGRWQAVHDAMAREKGVFALGDIRNEFYHVVCIAWLMEAKDTLDVLDMVEVLFGVIENLADDSGETNLTYYGVEITANQAINELNARMKEHGIGYQYDGGNLVRVDSQYIHSEVVEPALLLTSHTAYAKADEDFRLAHEHYRSGKYKDCVVAAQRAFESAMKAICTKRRWPCKSGDRASDLVKILRANNLFPDYLGVGFDSYIAMIKTGLPEIRNNAGGHGEYPDSVAVPGYVASYALHMTATNIVFLIEAEKGTR